MNRLRMVAERVDAVNETPRVVSSQGPCGGPCKGRNPSFVVTPSPQISTSESQMSWQLRDCSSSSRHERFVNQPLHDALLEESKAMAGIPCTRTTRRTSKDKTSWAYGAPPNMQTGVQGAKHVETGALP